MKIIKDLSVWNKLKKNFRTAENIEDQLGWFAEDQYGSDNDNLHMAQVAQWQEEGTVGGQGNGSGIPSRPFMRVGLREGFGVGYNNKNFELIMKDVAAGKSPLKAWKASANDFKQSLQNVMTAWFDPANAPSTVADKGFNDPLIETGQLRDNVNFKVGSD